jgi:integrase
VPTITLTQRAVEALKAPATGRAEYFDRVLPGFGLRVAAGGRKTWFVMYRVGGKKVRETIGTLAVVSKVEQARDLARDSLRQAQAGVHPVEQRRAAKQTATVNAQNPNSFRAVGDLYIERYASKNTKPSTWREARRQLEIDVFPKWGDRPIREITRHDVVELLDGITDRGSPVQANRTLARLRTLFNWAVDREIIAASPVTRMKRPTVEKERSRTLSDAEIRLFWMGCDRLAWPFGPICKLLLLTAQRRTEVAGMRWSEITLDQRLWTIPRERAKDDREHVVHLSDLAVDIISALSRFTKAESDGEGKGTEVDLVFTTTGKRHVSGYGKAKERLDKHMLDVLRAELVEAGDGGAQAAIGDWILHDLRRTAATGMAKLNIAPHVVDRILNHVSGTIRGVAAVYNRHAYIEERKAALNVWSRYVENLIRPATENVIQLVGRGGGAKSGSDFGEPRSGA